MAALGTTLVRRLAKLAGMRPSVARVHAPATSAAVESCDVPTKFLQKRPIFQPAFPVDRSARVLPAGEGLTERILSLNVARIRLDGLVPPPEVAAGEEQRWRATVEDARKVLRATQMDAARERMRASTRSCVPYQEFQQLCREEAGGEESGRQLARLLDESGSVIVIGNTVFLRPEMVTKAIEKVIAPAALSEPPDAKTRSDELQEMEEQKLEIDRTAAAQVRQELWAGLGFLILQTAGFMRLTFWELSWDVMEPICFYVTSMYFMAGYAFFLRTSREPSFEGFFDSRFAAKQQRLMMAKNFDINRYNELKRDCRNPLHLHPSPEQELAAAFRHWH